jgi:hypothetical protein
MSLANARESQWDRGTRSGSAVAFIGDQDGDDSPSADGAQYWDAGGSDSGGIYIVFGGRL